MSLSCVVQIRIKLTSTIYNSYHCSSKQLDESVDLRLIGISLSLTVNHRTRFLACQSTEEGRCEVE